MEPEKVCRTARKEVRIRTPALKDRSEGQRKEDKRIYSKNLDKAQQLYDQLFSNTWVAFGDQAGPWVKLSATVAVA